MCSIKVYHILAGVSPHNPYDLSRYLGLELLVDTGILSAGFVGSLSMSWWEGSMHRNRAA